MDGFDRMLVFDVDDLQCCMNVIHSLQVAVIQGIHLPHSQYSQSPLSDSVHTYKDKECKKLSVSFKT